jgi:hypothetical protein
MDKVTFIPLLDGELSVGDCWKSMSNSKHS